MLVRDHCQRLRQMESESHDGVRESGQGRDDLEPRELGREEERA